MKHTEGLMSEASLPEDGFELYFDERPGMVRIRFFDNLGPADRREDEEITDSIRFRYYDTWEYDIQGIEEYVSDNSVWLWKRAKEEEKQALSVEIRGIRNARLVEADNRVNIAMDSGEMGMIAAARQYRQSLRDIPDQEGFPYEVAWPSL